MLNALHHTMIKWNLNHAVDNKKSTHRDWNMALLHAMSHTALHQYSTAIFSQEHLIFEHNDLDQTAQCVASIFKPHRLKPCDHQIQHRSSMYHRSYEGLSVARLEYGMDVWIEPDCLEDFYLIQIPLAGYAEIQTQGHQFVSYSEMASILSPQVDVKMKWKAQAPQLTLKIKKTELWAHYQHYAPDDKELIFHPHFQLNQSHGQYFLQLISQLCDALQDKNHVLNHPFARQSFVASVYNALILGQPHQAQTLLHTYQEQGVAPRFISQAQEFIEAHLAEALSVEQIAQAIHVSPRRLFLGFQKHLQKSPMQYIRDLRFERAHRSLLQTDHRSVTEIAYAWGFSHLSRFSQEYKQRYGCLPSEHRR